MKNHSILLLAILIISMLILGELFSRISKESDAPDGSTSRNMQPINLFPEESFKYDNTGKWSLDEAFEKSGQVIRTAHLKQVDNSSARGAKPFYIYQADEGSFEKPADTGKNKFPLLFLSRQELFKGKALKDSVYLFLAPVRHYEILRQNINIQYEWIEDAPFLVQ